MREDRPQMDTRTLLRDRLRRSRDWTQTIDELEKELEGSGTKPEQSERLYELAALVEDVIPERDRALGLYQRAWKLHPPNLKALSRAREVYGEIGRYEMVAKLGEMELRASEDPMLPQIVGEALLDSGQKDKALPILQRALGNMPDSVRVKDALAAVTYDSEFWADDVERLAEEADSKDDAQAVRMLLRAARILKLEAPEDPRLEPLLTRIFAKDLEEPSANFIYETLLATNNRWDELEAHQHRRAERAPDHAAKVEALRMFALEWVQRFKDRDRGAKFFDAALQASSSNGAVPMRSLVAAFSLLRQVYGERNQWPQLLELVDAILLKMPSGPDGEDKLYLAIAAGNIAFDKLNDVDRAKKYFAVAKSIEAENPSVQDFIAIAGSLDDVQLAAGTMPMQAQREPDVAAEPAATGKKRKNKKTEKQDEDDQVEAAAAQKKAADDQAADAKAAAD